jgi:hypothetical protein
MVEKLKVYSRNPNFIKVVRKAVLPQALRQKRTSRKAAPSSAS